MSNVYFSNGNKLLPSTEKYIVRIFNLPAISIRDAAGNINKECPNICLEAPGICKEICYAYKRQSGNEVIVYGRRKANYDATLEEDFVQTVKKKIEGTINYYEKKDVKIIYRIHESGDFYHIDYLHKWVQISNEFKNNPKVVFMAYTKNIELLNKYLKREGKALSEINIKFKYSIMELSEFEGITYSKTSDFPDKVLLANDLRKQGLTFYKLYKAESDLPIETEVVKHCLLYKNKKGKNPDHTCASCEMKCYFGDFDVVSLARDI